MGCNCGKKHTQQTTFELRKTWSQKLINELSLMYTQILPKHNKTIEDWTIIFGLFGQVYPKTSFTDVGNPKQRMVVQKHLNEFYKTFLEIKEKKENG